MKITFWGVRGSIPTPGSLTERYGGNTACIEIESESNRLVIDAGTGIRDLGLRIMHDSHETAAPIDIPILLSHSHWDHIQGIPFFVPAYNSQSTLRIYGKGSQQRSLEEILSAQMTGDYFPIDFSMIPAQIKITELYEEQLMLANLKITWEEQPYHPGGTRRFIIEDNDSRCVYATDVELESMFFPNENSSEIIAQRDRYCRAISDADILIADGQYTLSEYESKVGWGHTAIEHLVDIAYDCGVKRLAVFHHDPLSTDTKLDSLTVQFRRNLKKRSRHMDFFFAREGLTIT